VAEIAESSRVPFGCKPDKGKKLCECSDSFLAWMVKTLWDEDLHAWAFMAKTIVDKRAESGKKIEQEKSLDAQADAFLKNHGYGGLARKH
jgi:hypothetical protein